jgi:hypothetical protein
MRKQFSFLEGEVRGFKYMLRPVVASSIPDKVVSTAQELLKLATIFGRT